MANNGRGVPPEFLRMMGGVAGNMDQYSSSILREMPDGGYGYVPSTKYFDQVKQLGGRVQYEQPPISGPTIVNYSPVPQQQEPINTMDISKYIGKEKKKEVVPQPNSQIELLKMALQPINDQLEKVCMLLGVIYQALEKEENSEPINTEIEDEVEDENASPEEQIALMEQKLQALPKAPTTEEIKETTNPDAIDINL